MKRKFHKRKTTEEFFNREFDFFQTTLSKNEMSRNR